MIRRGAGRSVLAALVALKFHPRRVNWIGGKAHMHVPEIASILQRAPLWKGVKEVLLGLGRSCRPRAQWRMCNLDVHKVKSRAFHNCALTYLGQI